MKKIIFLLLLSIPTFSQSKADSLALENCELRNIMLENEIKKVDEQRKDEKTKKIIYQITVFGILIYSLVTLGNNQR